MRAFLFSTEMAIPGSLFVVFCIVAALFELRHFAHVLQLSSYQFQGYFRSLRQNFRREWLLPYLVLIDLIILAVLRVVTVRSSVWLGVIPESIGMTAEDMEEYVSRVNLYQTLSLIAGGILFLLVVLCVIHYRPKKAKKKFVVTPRVRRLFITTAVLFLLLFAAAFCIVLYGDLYLNTTWLILWSLIFAWLPFVVFAALFIALANLINQPVEKSINNGFIRDAQRILREQPSLRIIGVTGSFGKTSVKYYLTTLLSEQFHVLMTPESYNTPMGIVRTIREQMKPTHEIFVCEMGARHVHDIKEITDFVHPDDGIVTAIGEQHLETFHSLKNIVSTKFELLDAVEEKRPAAKGFKLVNGDDENIRAAGKYPDAITYGLNEGNDFRAIDIDVTPAGTTFRVQLSERIADRLQSEQGYAVADASRLSPDTGMPEDAAHKGDERSPGMTFHTALVGAHNVQNIMGAIAAATLYGIPASKLKRAVRRIAGVPHRLELKRHGNVTILDDAYNANPTGAKTALETLALFRDQVKVLVTPGMVELGEKEAEYNEAFGAQAATVCDYIVLVGKKRTEPIAVGIRKAGFDSSRLFVKDSFDEAGKLMYELSPEKEKVILLENDLPDNY